jgi:tetratricopeptide (TPR) repeat protein
MEYNEAFQNINDLIDHGAFLAAKQEALELLKKVDSSDAGIQLKSLLRFNLTSILVDVAHLSGDFELAKSAAMLLEDLRDSVNGVVEPHRYDYNLANAKANLVRNQSVFDLSFSSIDILVEAKNLYWCSVKTAHKLGAEFPEQYVNLANCLKQQFRFSEALWYYDHILADHPDIPQAWANRSETLLILNNVSNSFSLKMLHEAAVGYENASSSKLVPRDFSAYYSNRAADLRNKIKEFGRSVSGDDHSETEAEFEALTSYRQYCCREALTLSEHGLYCSCAGAARDNLTIPMATTTIGGAFIPQMEAVLNRLKSEFSMARRSFYEYSMLDVEMEALIHEECFTDLHSNECLGLRFEKLRTSFRLCFGILDKIAVAVSEHHSLATTQEKVYFHNFWRLDSDGRRSKFEEISDPGLLSLYSLATDLNERKQGEWREFRGLRNALEHGFLVIYYSEEYFDAFDSYGFSEKVEFVTLQSFERMTKQLLQITRSAIFSFVFSFRIKGMESAPSDGIKMSLQRIDREP